ncbi:MAG: LuxR C-terminal-related transcriptional regulator [Tetrasphaera sp.]
MLPPCLGRRELLGQVRAELTTRRWVTLVGPPGVGKTLVARHTVAGRGDVAWVTLAPATTLEGVVAACLDELTPDTAPGDTDVFALKRSLDEVGRLLVLDGIDEASPDGLGELIGSLVAATNDARFLCTATLPAGQPGETVVRIEPLPVPGPDDELAGPALELFVSKLAGAGGEIVDLDQDEATLRSLLAASGGLPLLLEQFAVQGAVVGVGQVVPGDSVGAAVAASYAMVDARSQQAYRRLAALPSHVSLDVAAHVIGVPRAIAIGTIARLERHGLVELRSDERVGMLAPVRRHALDLARASGDVEAATAGIVRWADAALPQNEDEGAANAPWLADLDVLHGAVATACADPGTLDLGYRLANRAFGALYVAMKPREALALCELALGAGSGPADVGGQVARRAGICASEVRGTFEGLRFLDIAEEHARRSTIAGVQLARTASIRAEMFLDAGQLERARTEARSILDSDVVDSYVRRQAARTLMDAEVGEGHLAAAEMLAPDIIDGAAPQEHWLAIAARVLLAHIAWEQGRDLEAAAMARGARNEALDLAEDRVALLADILHRRVTGDPAVLTPEPESLPWAVRLGYQAQHAREMLSSGEPMRAAGQAADVVMLADSARLERDGVEARIVLGDALLAAEDEAQARSSYAAAVRRAATCPMPLRVADALDGLAAALASTGRSRAERFAGAAFHLRSVAGAVHRPRPGFPEGRVPKPRSPGNWVDGDGLSAEGLRQASRLEDGSLGEASPRLAASLTKAQLAVAELVGKGLTSKEIAEQLFLSPRTVDNHLAQIYRRLDIPSRARLAALMADV